MVSLHPSRVLFAAAVGLALAACSPDASEPSVESHRDTEIVSPSLDADVAGAPVIEITTTGGEGRLGLTDEVLYLGLTEQVASKVEKELEQAGDDGGIGGMIAGAVSDVVSGALTTPVQFPLDDVDDVRFENGRLEIDFAGEAANVDLEIGDEPLNEQFDPDEARRFAEAFRDLKGR